jgi:hypothetical protein
MEGIWGVADVDADEESSQSSHASKFEVEGGVPRIIRVSGAGSSRVSGAGDNIINGMYSALAKPAT